MSEKPYKRYGDEWRKYLMGFPKKDIIEMLRDVALERDELQKNLDPRTPSDIERDNLASEWRATYESLG
jgi:hypothetical protein